MQAVSAKPLKANFDFMKLLQVVDLSCLDSTLGGSLPLALIAPHWWMFLYSYYFCRQCHSLLAYPAQCCGHASPHLSQVVLKKTKKTWFRDL